MSYDDFRPRKRKRGAGRPVESEGNNFFCDYLKEHDLSVLDFYKAAEEVMAEKHPDMFPPPPLSRLTELRAGTITPNELSIKNIVKLCYLCGVKPNDVIINPFSKNGRW